MDDEHRIRADEDIVPHLRLEKRLLTWRAADKIERLTAERDALRAQVAEKDAALEKMDGDARWTISDVEHDLTDMRLRAEHAEAACDELRALLREEKVLNPTNFYAADRLRVRIDAALNKGGGGDDGR